MQYRSDIQGLRAVAVLSVILFHANAEWLPGGFIGVDIFFVISGFLMTRILTNNALKPFSLLKKFYLARTHRIVPAYAAMICVTTITASVLFIPNDYTTYQNSLERALLFLSNQYFAEYYDYFGPAAHEQPLLHTWSLAVEMQFYLFYPFIIIIVPRQHLVKVILLTIISLTTYIFEQSIGNASDFAYFQLTNRIPEFLIGAIAALKKCNLSNLTSNIISFFGIMLMGLSLNFITGDVSLNGLETLPACIGAAIMLFTQRTIMHSFAGISPMRYIGDLSYSLYLWHWPVLAFARYYLQDYKVSGIILVMVLLLTGLLSIISHQLIETGSKKSGAERRKTQTKMVVVLALMTFAIGLMAPKINEAIEAPLEIEFTRYADPTEICHEQVVGHCEEGDPNAALTVLVMGDSHAAQLNHFADVVGDALNVKFIVVTSGSCIPIPNFDIERINSSVKAACISQTGEIQNLLPIVDGVIIAGMWTFHSSSEDFVGAMSTFLRTLMEANIPVALMSQPPHLSVNPLRTRRFTELRLGGRSSIIQNWQEANQTMQMLSEAHQNTMFIDTTNLTIFNQPPMFHGNLIYFDQHHLNEIGSNIYGTQAAPLIREWVEKFN